MATAAPRDDTGPVAQPGDASQRILLRWTIGLRWVLLGVLAVALPLGDPFLGFHVNYAIAVPALALLAATNLWAQRRARDGRPVTARLVAAVSAADLAGIAVVLAASGGAANPLSALFFVHVALAASLLPAATTFALLALATAMFGALFLLPAGACCPSHPEHGAFSNHLYGMLLAFALSGAMVAYFLTRLRRALHQREEEIEALRKRSEQASRFAALGTLAAGTAHELATPLGTIAVLAGEIGDDPEPAGARRAAHAISAQVKRCREVIGKMQAGAQATDARELSLPLEPVLRAAVDAWRAANPSVEVSVRAEGAAELVARIAAQDLEMALCAVLDNARDAMATTGRASPPDADGGGVAALPVRRPIVVTLGVDSGAPFVRIDDEGSGVPPPLRERLGEPFLTTKEPGHGMGLGLYLVRGLLAQAGGALEVAAREPAGTSVRLSFGPSPSEAT